MDCMSCPISRSSTRIHVKVSQFQNEFMKHRLSQNTDKKLPSLHRAKILTIFRSYFGRNDDFINSFWNCLTFSKYSNFARASGLVLCIMRPNNFWSRIYIFVQNSFHEGFSVLSSFFKTMERWKISGKITEFAYYLTTIGGPWYFW